MIKIKPEVTEKSGGGNAKSTAFSNAMRIALSTTFMDAARAAFPAPKKRGRPPTGKAMTNAQRQAKFKALKKEHEAHAK